MYGTGRSRSTGGSDVHVPPQRILRPRAKNMRHISRLPPLLAYPTSVRGRQTTPAPYAVALAAIQAVSNPPPNAVIHGTSGEAISSTAEFPRRTACADGLPGSSFVGRAGEMSAYRSLTGTGCAAAVGVDSAASQTRRCTVRSEATTDCFVQLSDPPVVSASRRGSPDVKLKLSEGRLGCQSLEAAGMAKTPLCIDAVGADD
ncbi:hypothetical protein V8D89_007450 [Ganoderma adspersum]